MIILIRSLVFFFKGNTSLDLINNWYQFNSTHFGLINRDFNEVTNDGLKYCYEIIDSNSNQLTLITQLTNDETLNIEKQNTTVYGSELGEFSNQVVEFEK